MLLTLIKTRETRYGFHAVLMEANHIWGDKKLSDVYIPLNDMPLELFYRVTIPMSGIWLQGRRTRWRWPNPQQRKYVEQYLQMIQSSHEEIRLEVKSM